jgi:hypothetical protein
VNTAFDVSNTQKDSAPHAVWFRPPEDRRRWGVWRLNVPTLELIYEEDRYHYAIDLERCTTSAALLDWIFQIEGKDWGPKVLCDLIRAFDDIFDPQRNLCSGCLCGGMGKQINATAYLRERYKKRRTQKGTQ